MKAVTAKTPRLAAGKSSPRGGGERASKPKSGAIRVGIGGWNFPPWRGVFYPKGLPHAKELAFASRAVTSIEINGTYYSTFKRENWRQWCEETPDDFVFAVKASRFCTNRKVLAEGAPSIERFLDQGLTVLGPKLGPINWQLMPTKKFEAEDIAAFFELLPKTLDGVRLRHAIEVRHPSFDDTRFFDLARRHKFAVVWAEGKDVPTLDQPTAPFTYARFMGAVASLKDGYKAGELDAFAERMQSWATRGDVFAYFISAAKERNPAAAQALLSRLEKSRP